jgi:hypothetical protein
VASYELANEGVITHRRFPSAAEGVNPGEGGLRFLHGPAHTGFPQQAQCLAHNLAGIVKFT